MLRRPQLTGVHRADRNLVRVSARVQVFVLVLVLALVASCTPLALHAQSLRQPGDAFALSLSEQLIQDNNLYRVPADLDLDVVMPGMDANREDMVSRTSALIDGGWTTGRQEFVLNASVDSNRYRDNSRLDNTSGNGRADWNWQFARDWSGQVGASYGRTLSGFTNSRFFGKDVLETEDYHGTLHYQLTPHWNLSASARKGQGEHDTQSRQVDNFESDSTTFAASYLTRRGDLMGLQFRRTQTTFPDQVIAGGLLDDRNYVDRAATYEMKYAFTVKTSVQASAGYQWRHYPGSVLADFAGPIWNAALNWEPRAKTQITITQFQELKAYIDAESNHFEARGTRLTVAWRPTSKITLSADATREKHDYAGFDPIELASPARRDRLRTGQVALGYLPTQRLDLELAYRIEARDTTRAFYQYDDRSLIATARLVF